MATSYQRLSLDRMTAIVRGVTPKVRASEPFTSLDAADRGRHGPLETMPAGQRWFRVAVSRFPTRDPARVTARAVMRVLVQVLYHRTGDFTELERMVSEDNLDIIDAMRVPADWQQSTTGIRAIVQNGDVEVENIPPEAPSRSIVGIPFDVHLEAC